MKHVAVLGAGSARLGHDVRVWARDPGLARDMSTRRANPIYLPDLTLPAAVQPTSDLGIAVSDADLIVNAVPSHGTREVLTRVRPHLRPHATIVSATKGLEEGTLLRMSELVTATLGAAHPVAALSGPSFAAGSRTGSSPSK